MFSNIFTHGRLADIFLRFSAIDALKIMGANTV